MRQISKRIAKLEQSTGADCTPYFVFVGPNGDEIGPKLPVPDNIGDREMVVVRIVPLTAPARDADGNILKSARELDDDDPDYL